MSVLKLKCAFSRIYRPKISAVYIVFLSGLYIESEQRRFRPQHLVAPMREVSILWVAAQIFVRDNFMSSYETN